MVSKIHFISGLPRSGSTLLAAILRQNPRLHASISGPVFSITRSLLGALSYHNEFATSIDDGQRRRIILGAKASTKRSACRSCSIQTGAGEPRCHFWERAGQNPRGVVVL